MIIPEKTSTVRRFIVPAWALKAFIIGSLLVLGLAIVMTLDYWFVMRQIDENKQLKTENRRFQQQVQIFKNKMATIEGTLDRVKTFSTRLKVITNIEDRGGFLQSLNAKPLPDAATNLGESNDSKAALKISSASKNQFPSDNNVDPLDPETALLRKDYQVMDAWFSNLHEQAIFVEQVLQDQYELLADQKAFLSALPTRRPAVGYFTSGFGVRHAPFGGKVKMHEGLDIANYPGTLIRATADGAVVYSDSKPGYGQTVIIDHGYGLETWYGHAKRLLVKKGQKIRRGDQIALLGNSGRSTGPHVHYEVRVHGIPVNPLSYILED